MTYVAPLQTELQNRHSMVQQVVSCLLTQLAWTCVWTESYTGETAQDLLATKHNRADDGH